MRGDTSATHARHILSPHMHDIHIATHATYIIATHNIFIATQKHILSPHKNIHYRHTQTFTNDYIESEKFKQNNQYINLGVLYK